MGTRAWLWRESCLGSLSDGMTRVMAQVCPTVLAHIMSVMPESWKISPRTPRVRSLPTTAHPTPGHRLRLIMSSRIQSSHEQPYVGAVEIWTTRKRAATSNTHMFQISHFPCYPNPSLRTGVSPSTSTWVGKDIRLDLRRISDRKRCVRSVWSKLHLRLDIYLLFCRP